MLKMDKTDLLNEKKKELIERINAAEKYRKEVIDKVQKLAAKFSIGELSFFEYHSHLKGEFGDKTPEEWTRYYDGYIEKCKDELKKCSEKIRKIRTGEIAKRVVPLALFLIFTFSIYYYAALFGEKPVLFSPIESYFDNVNFSFNESGNFVWKLGNAGELNGLKISGEIGGEGNVKVYLQEGGKEFLILDRSEMEYTNNGATGNVIRDIEIPSNSVTLESGISNRHSRTKGDTINGNVYINRSKDKNVSINGLDNSSNKTRQFFNNELNNNSDGDNATTRTDKINNTNNNAGAIISARKFDSYCNGTCDLSAYKLNAKSYNFRIEIVGDAEIKIDKIVYELVQKENAAVNGGNFNETLSQNNTQNETSNFVKIEKRIGEGKEIKIGRKQGLKNVEVKTQIPSTWKINDAGKIRVHWKEGNKDIEFSGNDLNDDGYIDEVNWNVADLGSDQTFEIIVITKAEHLDSNRSFISDIYDFVKEQDGIWSETINDGEYVRATFERNLTNDNDITLFPRNVNGVPRIEVYEVNGNVKIASFDNLQERQYNKVLLTSLIGMQDTFDLKIVGGSLELDHVIDPIQAGTNRLYFNNTATGGACPTTSMKLGSSAPSSVVVTWPGSFTNSAPGNTDAGQWLPGNANIANITSSIQIANSVQTSRTSASFGQGWLLDENLVGYNIAKGNFTFNLSIMGGLLGAASNVERIFARVSVVNCVGGNFVLIKDLTQTNIVGEGSHSGGQVSWRANEGTRINHPGVSSIINVFVNVSTNDTYVFNTGDRLLIELGFGDASSTFSRTIGFRYNFAGSYVLLPLINDTMIPSINITSPLNNSVFSNATQTINYTVSDNNLQACWYTNSSGKFNNTITCGNNLTNYKWLEGINNVTIYANDSAGNVNSSSVTFFVDTTIPYIKLNSPLNATTFILGIFNITLNSTIFDSTNNKVNVQIYGVNSLNTGDFYKHGLLYQQLGVLNGTQVIYNWTSPVIVPDASTVALYHLDNNSKFGENDTNVYDFSGNQRNATVFGATAEMSGGKFGGGFYFNGTTSITGSNPTVSYPFTVYAWINYNGSVGGIVQVSGVAPYLGVRINSTGYPTIFAKTDFGGEVFAGSAESLSSGWHQVVGVFLNNTDKRLYVDGNNVINLTTSKPIIFPITSIDIGKYKTTSTDGFNGTIDEVAIWNRTLNGSEILDLYRLKVGKYYWKVNVTDSAGNNNESETREFYINATPVIITEVNATNITQTFAIINWTTNILANGSVNYGLTKSLGINVFDESLVIKHNISLNGSSAGTTYYYNVTSCSVDNVCATNGTFNFTTLAPPNQAPIIELVGFTNVGAILGGMRNVLINFSATDLNGAVDLNDLTARVEIYNISKGINPGMRVNSSCSIIASGGNTKNYTCTIGMWYFDPAGNYIVNATIGDNSGNKTENSSSVFSYESTFGFTVYPGAISWGILNPGDINKLSIDNLKINNTGNVNFTAINITAYNLSGASDSSYYILASNFFASVNPGECSFPASQLDENVNVSIGSFSSLAPGNLSINDGTAQEEIFFCLAQVPSVLPMQIYSTQGNPWEIALFAAPFVMGGSRLMNNRKRRRKIVLEKEDLLELFGDKLEELLEIVKENKLKKELKENQDYSKFSIEIPLGIFKENIGAAETLCKYLKENKGMRFAEIARTLNRDRRTIGLNYKNSTRVKEKIEIENGEIFAPVEIFADRRLSILESAVYYLKVEGYKNVEISKMLGKDQRNVWTLYSRAMKKLKNENKNI